MRLVSTDLIFHQLQNSYNIKHIPSLLIITPYGTEIDRIIDISNYKKQYTEFLKNAFEWKNTYTDLTEAFEKDSNNVELAYKLFMKNMERGEIEQIVKTGKKIFELENKINEDQLTKIEKTIFKDTRYYIKTSLYRFGKEAILRYFSEFPNVKFSKNIYRFLAFTYSKREQSENADNFFVKALKDFPDEYDFKKYFLQYCMNTKTQIKQARILAEELVNQKDFNDATVEKIFEELKILQNGHNH